MSSGEGEYWLDKPSSVNLLIKILIAACAVLVLADFFYHKHAEFHFMEFIGFDAAFGFAAYVGLITTAKGFRKLVMRREDYYGAPLESEESEESQEAAQLASDSRAARPPEGGGHE